MATDRKKLKDQLKGLILTAAGISNAETAIEQANEETFEFGVTADADQVERGLVCVKAFKVKSCIVTPTTALAAHASAYITQTVGKRDGAGGAAVTVATFDTATGGSNVSLAAFVPYTLTLSATLANRVFAVGNVLTFKSLETSTPVTPLCIMAVTVEYV